MLKIVTTTYVNTHSHLITRNVGKFKHFLYLVLNVFKVLPRLKKSSHYYVRPKVRKFMVIKMAVVKMLVMLWAMGWRMFVESYPGKIRFRKVGEAFVNLGIRLT